MLASIRSMIAKFRPKPSSQTGLNGQLVVGWGSTILWILLAVGPILSAVYYPVHIINCPHNWFHTSGLIDNNTYSVERVTRLTTSYDVIHTSFINRWLNRAPTTELTDFSPDTSFNLGRLSGRPLGRLLMFWHQDDGVMEIFLYPRDVLNEDLRLLPDSAATWSIDHSPSIMIRCRSSWSSRTNRQTMAFFDQTLVRYLHPWLPTISAAAILNDLDQHVAYHNNHLLQFAIDRAKLLVGLVLACLFLISHTLIVRDYWRYGRSLYNRKRGREFGVRRLSFIRLWLTWNLGRLLKTYDGQLNNARRAIRLQRKQREREPLVENIRFNLATVRLPAFEARLEGRQIPRGLQPYWKQANDYDLNLEARLKALDRLEYWLRSQRHEVETSPLPGMDPRRALQMRLDNARSKPLSLPQRSRMMDCLELYEQVQGDPRQHLGNYWLEQAIAATEIKSEPTVAAVNQEPLRSETLASPSLQSLDDVVELLDFSELVPNDVDHDHARAIIIWGCLHPGQRGRTMVKARYITVQYVKEDVRNKLRQDFHPDKYDRAMAFLIKVGVIMTDHKRKRHQPIVALNPHASEAVGVGQEIVRRVLAAKDTITELTTS